MADGEDDQNQENHFADLEASITDSFSRLQESIDKHAQKMSEIQDSAGDTLLSSDFMNSLNDKLKQISENNEEIIEQQEALKSEFEQLNSNISSLNTSVSELQQSISSFTLEADINAEVDSSELSFLTESFDQSADRISRSISSEILSLSEDLTRAYANLQTGTSITPTLLLEISDSITETITTSIQENINTLRSDFSTGIELLEVALEENLENYGIPSAVGQSLSNIESHIRQLVDVANELRENLLNSISSLRENISSIEVSSGQEINYSSVKEAVRTGLIDALQQVQMQQFAQAGRAGQMRSRPNEPQQQTNVQTASPLPTANFGNVSIPSFAGRQGPPQISRLLTGEVSLNEEFPEFLSDLEAQNKSLSNTIKLTNSDLANFEDVLSKVVRTGENLQEINLGHALGDNLVEGTEEYNKVIDELFNKFKEVIGARGEELVATTRNIIQESQEQLRYEQVMPDNFVGLISRDLGYEKVYQSLNEMAQRIEDSFIEASANINELHEDQNIVQRMNQQIAGSANRILEVYRELEQQGASVTEIQRALKSVTAQIEEETSEMREESQKFANTQDEVLSNLRQQITSVEEVKQRRESINEIYQRYFGMLQTVQNRYEDMQTLISGIGEALSNPRMWGFAALNGVLTLAYQVWNQILKIDSAVSAVADSTGMISSGLEDVKNITMELAAPLMARGATLQEVAATVGTIRSELQGGLVTSRRLNMTEQELAKTIGKVATGFNVSNEAAGEMLTTLQAITNLTGDALSDAIGMTQELASQAEVAPKAVFKDIREASEEIAKFGAVSAENIAKAAVSARSLGTNLNEVLGIAESFRNDIVGSLQSLQQAELMLGQPIPAERLVSASFKSPEAFTSQLRSTLQNLNLNLKGPLATFRLQALSDAFGVSVMRLRQMVETARLADKELDQVTEEQRWEAMSAQIQASQTSFDRVTNTITGLGQAILNTLAQPILNTLNPLLDTAAKLFENIIDSMTNAQGKITEGFSGAIETVKKEISEFGKGATGTREKVAGLASSFVSFAESAYKVGKVLVDLTDDIVRITEAISPLISFLADTVTAFESLGETIGGDVGGTVGVLAGIGSLYGGFRLISSGIGMLSTKITSAVIPVLRNLGSSLAGYLPSALTSFTSATSTATSATSAAAGTASSAASVFSSFGAQALMVAGAVYTISESFETFASLSWDEMKKGIAGVSTALLGLTGAVAAVQVAVSTYSATAVQMAAAGGVLLSFAGSVWILSDAMGAFANAGMAGVEAMAASLGVITAFGAGLAALIGGTGGIGAGAGLAAAGVLGAFGLALKLVGSAILDFAESAQMIGDALETINQLENVDELAGKLRNLGSALSTMPDISLANIFAGMIGEGVADQLEMLVELGRQAQPLDNVANSVNRIADALERLKGVEVSGTLSQINEITSTSFTEGAGNFLTSIGTAVSEMFSIDTEPQPTTQTRMGQQETVNTQAGQAQTPTVDPYKNLDGEQLQTEGQSYTSQKLQNEEQMINLLQQIAESENALLNALRNGQVAVYMDGDKVTDTVFKKANQRNSRR